MKRQQSSTTKKRPLVYVAMSGGVDSSVAAALLLRADFDVVGVFMKQWSSKDHNLPCVWKEEREEAMRAAASLGIPFKTWDFSREYEKEVVTYMIREYKTGRTPNPDVMCNKEIKFGLFFDRAMAEGADYIATGHYVRKFSIFNSQFSKTQINSRFKKLSRENKSIGDSKFEIRNSKFGLLQAIDQNKDQSYFLWTLKSKQLEKCLFPVGEYDKPTVRKLAKKFKLPNADKKDSQGVCFIGPLDVRQFLKTYIKPKKGKILCDGKIIGEHDGVYYYTIGQRHGLDIKHGAGPYYVVGKDIKKNIIFVGDARALLGKDCVIQKISWINTAPKLPIKLDVKIRYRTKSVKAILSEEGHLRFIKPTSAITSGQSAVFYKGEQLLGGGIIK